MRNRNRNALLLAALAAAQLASIIAARAAGAPPQAPAPAVAPSSVVHITLEEAKERALGNNKLLNLAALNAQSKAFAVKAARADYFPKVVGTEVYLHFNDDLGTVLSTQGRTVSGPRGRPLAMFPATSVDLPVLNQDTSVANIGAVQPLTDLLKVRQGVKIAQADQQIAQAQEEEGIRKVASGVEQLYWGLLAVRRIQAGAAEGLQGAEMIAKTGSLEARTALVEARQAVQEVDKQAADLQAQLVGLLDLPSCTTLELVEPPLPLLPYHCADDMVGLALASSPDIREAEATICKAKAALAAGKLDYVPSIGLVGGYVNQTGASYIQQDIGYVGVVGSYTFVDWGKRRNVVRERQNLVGMATLKLEQTRDDVRLKVEKAFRDWAASQETLKIDEEMVGLRKEAEKKATTPEAMTNPTALDALLKASKKRAEAEVDAVKADLAYRQAYVELMSLVGK
jgi:outer membrane protein